MVRRARIFRCAVAPARQSALVEGHYPCRDGVAVAFYLLYRAGRELLEAGEKALAALATLLAVFVRTLPPILLAGAAASAGAWVINHVNL